MNISKNCIQDAIRLKDDKIELYKNDNTKSEVWKRFECIKFDNNKVDFVCCIYCKNVFAYTAKNGTATLSRHKCLTSAPIGNKQKKLDEYAPKPLPKNVVDHLARKQLALVAKDLHPLNITEGTFHVFDNVNAKQLIILYLKV